MTLGCIDRAVGWLSVASLITLAACDSQPKAPPGATTTHDAAVDPSSSSDEDYRPEPPYFACEPGALPTVSPLRPLSRIEYLQTLADLLRWSLSDGDEADAVLDALEVPLAQIPRDDPRLEAARPTTSQAHVEGHYETASAIAEALTSSSERIARVVGVCAADGDTGDDAACAEAFIRRFGERVSRRPLGDEEVAFLRDEVLAAEALSPAALRDLITAMLMSPSFLFHIELGGDLVDGTSDVYRLAPYELASRLSYLFWRSMPDDELFAAAAGGALMSEDGYRAEVERVFSDPRTVATLDAFFSAWLDLEGLPQPADEVGSEPFDTFAGLDRPTPALRRHMADEVLALARYHTWTIRGTLDDLFTSDRSFATTEDLAAIYEVPVWDGVGEPPRFEPGERTGLLTRAAMLVSGTWHTLPIHKGITIRRRILCDALPPPPEGAQNTTIDLPGPYTQRQYAEALTMQDGTSCAGCHAWMNPIGFSTEGFDALGRRREAEMTWDEATGAIDWLPIDATAAPLADRSDKRVATDPIEATALVLESGKPHACVARYYFRFTFGRLEDLAEDGCPLERLRDGLWQGRPLAEVLKEVALMPEFKVRRIGALERTEADDGAP